jgi:hypothetical protein
MEVPAELLEAMVAYVAGTQPQIVKAAEARKETEKRAGAVVDKLIKAGMVRSDKREAAVQASITDPLAVLSALEKAAEVVIEMKGKAAAPTMGKSAGPVKQAGSDRPEKPMSESDRVFLERLNLARPTA